MKKIKAAGLLFLFSVTTIFAQDIADHAIGLRLGDSDGFGTEISYQRALNSSKRLEFDLGYRGSRGFTATKLVGLYQWVQPLEGDFNWYYGFGAGLGYVSFDALSSSESNLFVFGAGNIGVEYSFDFPLLLSLDIRPEVGLLGYSNFNNSFDFDIGLGVRYQF